MEGGEQADKPCTEKRYGRATTKKNSRVLSATSSKPEYAPSSKRDQRRFAVGKTRGSRPRTSLHEWDAPGIRFQWNRIVTSARMSTIRISHGRATFIERFYSVYRATLRESAFKTASGEPKSVHVTGFGHAQSRVFAWGLISATLSQTTSSATDLKKLLDQLRVEHKCTTSSNIVCTRSAEPTSAQNAPVHASPLNIL